MIVIRLKATCATPLNSELIKHLKSQKLAFFIKNNESILEADLKKKLSINIELALALQLTISLGVRLGQEMNEATGALDFKVSNCNSLQYDAVLDSYELEVSYLSKYAKVALKYFC